MTNKLMKFCEESGLLRKYDISDAEYEVDDTSFIKWQLDELKICSIKWEIAENRIRTAVAERLDYLIAAAHGAGLYRKLYSIMDLKELFKGRMDKVQRLTKFDLSVIEDSTEINMSDYKGIKLSSIEIENRKIAENNPEMAAKAMDAFWY